jgi:hypothetical protein
MIGSDTAPDVEVVKTLTTPFGSPRPREPGEVQGGERGELGRLDDDRAARASAGAILRVAIASGKFHGVIRKHGPTGCCETIMRPCPRGSPVAPLDAGGLLAEPAQELAAVGDLAARLGERLAHLDRHEQRELLLALLQQVERAAEDLRALARGVAAHAGNASTAASRAAFPSAGDASAICLTT